MIAVAPDIGHFQNQIVRKLVLHTKVPLLVAWIIEILAHRVKSSEVGCSRRKRPYTRQRRRLRRCCASKQIRNCVATGKRGCAERNRAGKWRCESQIGNWILVDKVVGDAIAATENELAAAGVPGKAQSGRRISVAVERRASQVDSAKRSNSQSADGRLIVRIEVGEQISAFRYPARTLKPESQIECQRPRHAEVVLDKSESIEREVMPVGWTQYLLKNRGRPRLESSDVRIG